MVNDSFKEQIEKIVTNSFTTFYTYTLAKEEGFPPMIPIWRWLKSKDLINEVYLSFLYILKSKLFIISINNKRQLLRTAFSLAEEEGFEPPIPVKVCWFSRPVHSTALPLLRMRRRCHHLSGCKCTGVFRFKKYLCDI